MANSNDNCDSIDWVAIGIGYNYTTGSIYLYHLLSSMLRRLWEGWKKVAFKVGNFISNIMLTIIYFVLLGPFAVIRKIVTLLGSKPKRDSYWEKFSEIDSTVEGMREQY